jgi:hypothetical protein
LQKQSPKQKQKNKKPKLAMVVHTCNPSSWRLRQEDPEFKASLGYIARWPVSQVQGRRRLGGLQFQAISGKMLTETPREPQTGFGGENLLSQLCGRYK